MSAPQPKFVIHFDRMDDELPINTFGDKFLLKPVCKGRVITQWETPILVAPIVPDRKLTN